jgi:hypothetical protein
MTNRAMGHHFLDVHLKPAHFREVWTANVLKQLRAMLDQAVSEAAGSDCERRVNMVDSNFEKCEAEFGRR